MKIQTHLDINDRIFFIDQQKVIESVVRSIKVTVKKDDLEIMYVCNKDDDSQIGLKVFEPNAFKTKKELIDSL